MSKKEFLKYEENEDYLITIDSNSFVTFLGVGNKKLLNILTIDTKNQGVVIDGVYSNMYNSYKLRRIISYVLNKDLDTFVAETVEDEIAFGLEGLARPKNEIIETINSKARSFHLTDLLRKSPSSLGSTDKAKLKILSSLIFEPKVLVLDNILAELDNDDKVRIVDLLKEYVNKGNIVLNFTNNIEETLCGDRVIILSDEKVIADGTTKSILNEEKLLKRLGLGLPFIVELNKYLIDYNIIKGYELDMEKLVNKIWK